MATAAASSVLGATAAAAAAASTERPRVTVVALAAASGGLGGFLIWQVLQSRRKKPLDRAIQLLDTALRKQPKKVDACMTALEYGIQVDQWILKLSGGTELAPAALRLAARAPQLEHCVLQQEVTARHKQDRGSRADTAAIARRKRKLEALLCGSGVDTHVAHRAACLVAKDVSLGDPYQQVLEDAVSLTFLANELAAFEKGKDDATVVDACAKAWKKMSRAAHALAIGLEYSPRCFGCLVEAITFAEGLGATNDPVVSPRLPANAVALLRATWHGQPTWQRPCRCCWTRLRSNMCLAWSA